MMHLLVLGLDDLRLFLSFLRMVCCRLIFFRSVDLTVIIGLLLLFHLLLDVGVVDLLDLHIR